MLRIISQKAMPILTDEQGKPQTFYHGTNEKFDKFERKPGKRYVLWSEFPVNSPGHFFSPDPEYAASFGRNVLQRQLDVNKILLNPKEYPHMSVDAFPPALEEELRYILEPMIEEETYTSNRTGEPVTVQFVDVGVNRFYIKDADWIYNLVGPDGLKWDALDNEGVVQRMKELGYDATYVDEGKDENGHTVDKPSIFVVDSKQIIPV